MYGGRITSEEKSTLSTYIGLIVVTVLVAAAIYFFFLAEKRTAETTGFDANRPVPSEADLRHRLKPESYAVVREGATETAFQHEFWNNDRPGSYADGVTAEPPGASVDKVSRG